MLVQELAQSIKRMENVNPSYNNPGGIWDMKTDSIKRYATYEEGYDALVRTIQAKINKGYNLYQFFNEYAPAGHGDNDPNHYAENVGTWTGIDPNTRLLDVANGGSTPTTSYSPDFSIDVFGSFPTDTFKTITDQLTPEDNSLPWIVGILIGGVIMATMD